jgi:hypothetical protein
MWRRHLRARQQLVLPGKRGLRCQKLILKANLVLDCRDQCMRLLQGLLHRKHVKGLVAMHARAGRLGAVRPVLGTIPNIRAVPGKVTKTPHT